MLKFRNIFMRIIQNAFPLHSITACPARFLIIIFYAFRDVVMNYEPDVRLINSHSKGYGCYHYLYVFIQKLILPFGSYFTVDACMISNGFDIIFLKKLSKFFGRFSISSINNSAFSFILTNKPDKTF